MLFRDGGNARHETDEIPLKMQTGDASKLRMKNFHGKMIGFESPQNLNVMNGLLTRTLNLNFWTIWKRLVKLDRTFMVKRAYRCGITTY